MGGKDTYLLIIKPWTPYLLSILYFPGAFRGFTGTPSLNLVRVHNINKTYTLVHNFTVHYTTQ